MAVDGLSTLGVIEYVNVCAWCLVMDSGDVEVLNVHQTATDI